MDNVSTLKKLAVCLGCCGCTEDIKASTNAEVIDFICSHIESLINSGVTSIKLVEQKKELQSGYWTDAAGESHDIEIRKS